MKPVLCIVAALLAALSTAEAKKDPRNQPSSLAQLQGDERILHALNRLSFGARPGDVARVRQMGLQAWINKQLQPESVAENPALEARLRNLDSLRMTNREITENYPPPQVIVAVAQGRMPMPEDPERRALMEWLVQRFPQGRMPGAGDRQPLNKLLTNEDRRRLWRGSPEDGVAYLKSLPAQRMYDIVFALPQAIRTKLCDAADPQFRQRLQQIGGPGQIVIQQLFDQKLLRSIYSERQLSEVLTDFWFNHFNIYLQKGADLYLTTGYERDAIRPYVLGHFKDMLLATAKSPAMLFYLDNWQSVGQASSTTGTMRNPKRGKNGSGLNENYARELLELHTLGVDGGYTQKDVTEVARCFTGWTITDPRNGGEFLFNARVHDTGEKTVLGVKIPAGGGIEDGLKVLDILSAHPSTAGFISSKLAMRFVSDDPPQALVNRMAKTFQESNGDLRAVMKTMLDSPEFWSPAVYRVKFKLPLEMVASAVRALDGKVDYSFPLAQQVAQLGQPLYRKEEPTGYSNDSSAWVNSAALLARMNVALALVSNKVPGVTVDQPHLTAPADAVTLAHKLLSAEPSQALNDALSKNLAEDTRDTPKLVVAAGLTLGSPDFQRR